MFPAKTHQLKKDVSRKSIRVPLLKSRVTQYKI